MRGENVFFVPFFFFLAVLNARYFLMDDLPMRWLEESNDSSKKTFLWLSSSSKKNPLPGGHFCAWLKWVLSTYLKSKYFEKNTYYNSTSLDKSGLARFRFPILEVVKRTSLASQKILINAISTEPAMSVKTFVNIAELTIQESHNFWHRRRGFWLSLRNKMWWDFCSSQHCTGTWK